MIYIEPNYYYYPKEESCFQEGKYSEEDVIEYEDAHRYRFSGTGPEGFTKIFYKNRKYRLFKKDKHDSGYDVRVCTPNNQPIILEPGKRIALDTGFRIVLEEDWEATIRPRSGLAKDKGITILNSPGTIDNKYKGEIKIIIINLGNENFQISDGDRLAQITFQKVERTIIGEYFVESIDNQEKITYNFGYRIDSYDPFFQQRSDDYERNNYGFGSSGVK